MSSVARATEHERFVGDLIDQMRKQRMEKSRGYRHLPYFQHLGSDEVFEALERVRQGNLHQIQLKMQKDCSYLQHMDDMSLEGRNAESVRKRVQEGKLQGGFRQIQNKGNMTVCGCLDCQLRLANKQFTSSFQYEQAKEILSQKVNRSKLTHLGAAWHGKTMLTMHLSNAKEELGSALHVAVLRGETEVIRMLCSRSECDIDYIWNGLTALDIAISRGLDEVGEILLTHRARLRRYANDSLCDAVMRGSTLLLRALLLPLGSALGMPPASIMAEVVSIRNPDGNSPLHLACLLPDREAMIRILLAYTCDPNRENMDGFTPLDCAVYSQNRSAWRLLIQASGQQAKHKFYEAEAADLKFAVARNNLFLVQNAHIRADDDRKDKPRPEKMGEALHIAVSTKDLQEELIQYLVDQGADVNTVADNMTVLDRALKNNYCQCENILGKHARLLFYQDWSIFRAVKEKLTGVVRYLCSLYKRGILKDDPNVRIDGITALHYAASTGQAESLKAIITANFGSVSELTPAGKTSLDIACEGFAPMRDHIKETAPVFIGFCQTIDFLLSRGVKLKSPGGVMASMSELLEIAKNVVKSHQQDKPRPVAAPQKASIGEKFPDVKTHLRKMQSDDEEFLKRVEAFLKAQVGSEDKKGEAYKECDKLAKKVLETREVLQANLKGEAEKLPEYLSSKYYQIRIDVLRRKLSEKDQQIEEALKKMDFAEEDYLWLLRKKMRDLRLKYHPDKITDRQITESDYEFYEKITKAYDVLCCKEERDKYLEMSNHVEWLQMRGEEHEAKLVEKAIYDHDPDKAKKKKKPETDPSVPTKEHVERAKKKLQERRDEDTWDKSNDKMRALTMGTPNKCKAPIVVEQKFNERTEDCLIDIEWVCKCAMTSTEKIEYELKCQAIDNGSAGWVEVYRGFDNTVSAVGPFPVGNYEFMVRAGNSVGWGEWSEMVMITLTDPRWDKQQKRESEKQALKESAKNVQNELQQILYDIQELMLESRMTIHKATNLLFHLQLEMRRARGLRQHLQRPAIISEAEGQMKELEKWRDNREAFTEWKSSLTAMRSQMLDDTFTAAGSTSSTAAGGTGQQRGNSKKKEQEQRKRPPSGGWELDSFLQQDEHYFGTLTPAIRNLTVQTLLGLDEKRIFKKLTVGQKERIVAALERAAAVGRANVPPYLRQSEDGAGGSEKMRTIFTKHQVDQLLKLLEKFTAAPASNPDTVDPKAREEAEAAEAEAAAAAALAAEQKREQERERQLATEKQRERAREKERKRREAEAAAAAAAEEAAEAARLAEADSAAAALGVEHHAPATSSTATASAARPPPPQRPQVDNLRTLHVSDFPWEESVDRDAFMALIKPYAVAKGCRMAPKDALIRFESNAKAKVVLAALDAGKITVKGHALSGNWAPVDRVGEDVLREVCGLPPAPTPAPPPPKSSAVPAQAPVAPKPCPAQPYPARTPAPAAAAAAGRPVGAPPSKHFGSAAMTGQVPGNTIGAPRPPVKPNPPTKAIPPTKQIPCQVPTSLQPRPPAPISPTSTTTTRATTSLSVEQGLDKISLNQVVSEGSQAHILVCGLCNSLAKQPEVTICCQRIWCSGCLCSWLSNSDRCPQCKSVQLIGDGSTGGSEGNIRRLEGNSGTPGPYDMIHKLYSSLRVRCANSCGWSGDMFSYEKHAKACPLLPRPAAHTELAVQVPIKDDTPQSPPPKVEGAATSASKSNKCPKADLGQAEKSTPIAPAALPSATSETDPYVGRWIVVNDHVASDAGQLTLKSGDIVNVTQSVPHGWALGTLEQAAPGGQEEHSGWFPTHCLPDHPLPPPPLETPPPPSAPPVGATRITRDFDAVDLTQLSVRIGDLVEVGQRAEHGWTYVTKTNYTGPAHREGWVPDWAIQG